MLERLLALAALAAPQAPPAPAGEALRVGEERSGTIEAGDPVVRTATLDARYTLAPTVGRSFSVRVEESGTFHLDLCSYLFDAYLVLEDGAGVLAEDDDGLVGSQARVVVELEAGRDYVVRACALHGGEGAFTLALGRGAPPALAPVERARAEREDAERRLAAAEEAFGPGHLETVRRGEALALLAYRQGDFRRARDLLRHALEVYEEVRGPAHLDTVAALNNLGAMLVHLGEYAEGRSVLERAVGASEQLFGAESAETAACIGNLATLLRELGEYEEARPLLERSLAIREAVLGPDDPETVTGLNELALLFERTGRHAEAQPLFERALRIHEEVLGPDHPRSAMSVDNLARNLGNQGKLDEARPLHERALGIRERLLGPDHPETALGLNNLGLVLRAQGDFDAAKECFGRAHAIRAEVLGPKHPDTVTSLNSLAIAHLEAGELDAALELERRVLALNEEVLGPRHPWTGMSLGVLAHLHRMRGEPVLARPLYERALDVLEGSAGEADALTAAAVAGLGLVLRDLGEAEAALRLQERARRIAEEVHGLAHPTTAKSLANLALAQIDLGRAREAWETLRTGRGERAARHARLLLSMTESERYLYLAQVGGHLEIELGLAELLDEPAIEVAAYEDLLAWKGQVARGLSASNERLFAAAAPEQRELLAELRATQARLSGLLLGTEGGDPARRRREVEELRGERNRLELALLREADPAPPDSISFAALRSRLPERSAVLDFFVRRSPLPGTGTWTEPRLTAWVARPDRDLPARVELGSASRVERAVREHLRRIVEPASGDLRGTPARAAGAGDPAEELHALLWAPLAEHLEGVELVLVSPDAFLALLPFETLRLPDGSFAVEHHAFAYQQSLVPRARSGSDRSAELDSLLAVGAVDFRGVGTGTWPDLPATAPEVAAVRTLHEARYAEGTERLLLRGAEPTEARLKRELPRHRILHLATHGFFDRGGFTSLWDAARAAAAEDAAPLPAEERRLAGRLPGLLAGLVCAASRGDEDEDGLLTAEEVSWLDLGRVELVVLSACDTALGRTQSGEGMLGLRRAFTAAGARTVVSSLWSVQDRSTAELMEAFYRRLFEPGTGRLEALRAAQLEVLRRNRREHGDPLPSTWGAFVLSGDWR